MVPVVNHARKTPSTSRQGNAGPIPRPSRPGTVRRYAGAGLLLIYRVFFIGGVGPSLPIVAARTLEGDEPPPVSPRPAFLMAAVLPFCLNHGGIRYHGPRRKALKIDFRASHYRIWAGIRDRCAIFCRKQARKGTAWKWAASGKGYPH